MSRDAKPQIITTVVFTDHGQDFLRWQINAAGTVIDCQPFQASIWCGRRVTNLATLKAGGHVELLRDDGTTTNIRYRIAGISRRKGRANHE